MKKSIFYILGISLLISFTFTSCKKSGCTNETAKNFNADADKDDGSCIYAVKGCTDQTAKNFNAAAEENDGSCEYYLASSEVKTRNVVIEDLTGIRCGWCPAGARNAKDYSETNPGKVIIIAIQSGGYAGPGPNGEPNTMTTQFGPAFISYFQPAGYPAAAISRTKNPKTYTLTGNNWKTLANTIIAENSVVNTGAKATWDAGSRTLTVNAELYYTGTETESNYINIALLENDVEFPQEDYELIPPPYWDNDYIHDHVLRDLLTGQWGDEVTTAETVEGTRIERTYTAEDVDELFNINNCEVVIFVTRNKEYIHTGTVVSIN